ncbi:MAG: T9SS type A sorting domain-containing protein [Bacteroidota bacterium]
MRKRSYFGRLAFFTLFLIFSSSTVSALELQTSGQQVDPLRLRPQDSPAAMRNAPVELSTPNRSLPDEPKGIVPLDSLTSQSINRSGLFEIARMANAWSYLRNDGNPIAHDPKTKQVAVAYRGPDRSDSGDGRSMYVRYAQRHGREWGDASADMGQGGRPQFPSVFLPNAENAPWPHVVMLWIDDLLFGNGQTMPGLVRAMYGGIGHPSVEIGRFSTPPDWDAPREIIMNQHTGDLYSAALGLEPGNGASTGEIYMLRSSNGGQSWSAVTFDDPLWTRDMVPSNAAAASLRLDISPDGSTMVAAWVNVYKVKTDSGRILDDRHEIAWRIWTQGMYWGPLNRIRLSELQNRPAPFENRIAMSWDMDVVFDYRNALHFLTVCSADLDAFDPYAEAGSGGAVNLAHVDSTFATEILVDGSNVRILPIGPVRRVRTDRVSFTTAAKDEHPLILRNETKWARNLEGTVIYAKWISPRATWTIADENGQATLFPDSISQVYVNGRHVDTTDGFPWYQRWAFDTPAENSAMRDSLMRVTALTDVSAKFTRIARYAGDAGQLHISFVEWGKGETPDSEPLRGEQILWYIKDVAVPVMNTEAVHDDAGSTAAGPVSRVALEAAVPHPFSNQTSIRYSIQSEGFVTLRLFDALGRVAATAVNGFVQAGSHTVTLDAGNLPPGLYLLRLESGGSVDTRPLLHTR